MDDSHDTGSIMESSTGDELGLLNRRTFVRTTGLFVVSLGLGGSCSDPGAPNSGTLRVSITGFPNGIPSYGSAVITYPDGDAEAITIPAIASAELSVIAGRYSVRYTPPSGFGLAPGQENPRIVEVPVGGIGSAEFSVVDVPPPPDLIFHSDFSTAIGDTSEAFRDTDKDLAWSSINGSNPNCAVIAAVGLDFPTANALHIVTNWNGSGSSSKIPRLTGGIPVPAVGQSRFYRWYMRFAVPPSVPTWGSPHPIQDGPDASSFNWELETRRGSGGNFASPIFTLADNPFPNNRWAALDGLPINQTFRFEVQIHRIGEAIYNLHTRIFNSANVQILSDQDFLNQTGTGTESLADNPPLNISDLSQMANFQCGTNGAFQGTTAEHHPVTFCYQGGFAIRSDDWCGPYNGGI